MFKKWIIQNAPVLKKLTALFVFSKVFTSFMVKSHYEKIETFAKLYRTSKLKSSIKLTLFYKTQNNNTNMIYIYIYIYMFISYTQTNRTKNYSKHMPEILKWHLGYR